MKRTIMIIALSFGTTFCFGQNNDWTKSDRNDIYEECLNAIKYKSISQEQKENIALCYMDEISKKYTKNEYQAKIDIEIKKIKETTLIECGKNLGIDLKIEKPKPETEIPGKPVKKVNEGNFTKEDLIGTWKNENAKLFFNEDNTFLAKTDAGDSFGSTWYINKDKNIIVEDYGTLYVKSFDGKTLRYSQILKTKVLGVTTKKKNELFTATKVE